MSKKTDPDNPEKIGQAYVEAWKAFYNAPNTDPDLVARCRELREDVIAAKLNPTELEEQARLQMLEQ